MTAFREGLLPMFQQEYAKEQQPIYGDAQKASFMTSLNELAKGASDTLRQNLASAGALDSGRAETGLANIEQTRLKQASDFYSQLPLLEELQRRQGITGLLQQGLGWAGRAPVGSTTTTDQSGTNISNQFGTSTGIPSSAGVGQNIANLMGLIGMDMFGGGKAGGGGLNGMFGGGGQAGALPDSYWNTIPYGG